MNFENMLGHKFFRVDEDESVHMIRVVNVTTTLKDLGTNNKNVSIEILNYDTDKKERIKVRDLKGYTPLEPDGIFTAAIVEVNDINGKKDKDVICTVAKYLEVKYTNSAMPYAICRQSITDIFNNLVVSDEQSDMLVGVSVNRDDCPANFDFKMMLAASGVKKSTFVNFYRNDTLEDILKLFNRSEYDEVLGSLYARHVKATGDTSLILKNKDKGWCKNLKLLLKENAFQADINQMLGITDVKFKVSDYLEDRPFPGDQNKVYQVARDDFRYWLSYIYKVNIKEANILEYDHDINMADFNNSTYLFLRDSEKKLYLVVYVKEGEYLQKDLEEKAKEMDFSTKFKLDFYSKYNSIDNTQSK